MPANDWLSTMTSIERGRHVPTERRTVIQGACERDVTAFGADEAGGFSSDASASDDQAD